MKENLSHELETGLPAGEVWAVYGTMRLPELIVELLPHLVPKIDVEEGDGGVGTVLHVTFSPGESGMKFQREKFVKIDNKQRVKGLEVLEGGLLDLGFLFCMFYFEIVEKSNTSSIIISKVTYEIADEVAPSTASTAFINILSNIAKAIVKYLMEKKGRGISS